MKTIVCATDFSDNATHAARVAAQLARQWQARRGDARLILMHAYHYPPDNPAKTGDFPTSVQVMRDESLKALHKLADKLTDSDPNLLVNVVAHEGHTIPAIREVTSELKADLLVMSTVGTAPQSAQLFGSIATDMIPQTNVPLLLVPPGAALRTPEPQNLVLGIDLESPPNALALDAALTHVRWFNGVVNVVCVNNNPDKPAIRHAAEHVRKLIGTVPHTLSIVPGEDVNDAILAFAHDNKADLIVMMPQPHNWFWQLFLEGDTQRLARLAHVPLLAVV